MPPPIKPLFLDRTPATLTHTIAASLEMPRKEGVPLLLLDKIALAQTSASPHLCTTAQNVCMDELVSRVLSCSLSLSLPYKKTKPTLRSQDPNVLIHYPSVPALPLPPAPLSHTSVRSLELNPEACPFALRPSSTLTVPAEALFHRNTQGELGQFPKIPFLLIQWHRC